MLHTTKMAFVGSGVMGEAMIKGLLTQNLTAPDCIVASDPWQERIDYIQATYGVAVVHDNAAAVRGADIVILSIKPQSLPKVGKDLHSRIHPDALVLSILAGTRINTLQNKLFHDRIVRAMPNTPAQLGKGMTVWTATHHVTAEQIRFTETILGAMGEQLQVDE